MEEIEDLTENVKKEKTKTRELEREIQHYEQQILQY